MHYKEGKLLIVVWEERMRRERSHSSSLTADNNRADLPPSSPLSLIMANHLPLSLSHCVPASLHLATWYLIRHLCFQHTQCKLLLAGPARAQSPSGERTQPFLSVCVLLCVCVVCTGECKQRGVWCVHPLRPQQARWAPPQEVAKK